MELLFVILLLGFNFFISWSNASYVGRYWSESKEVGGSFSRYVVCGYVMAVAGFTMVYGYILILISPIVLQYYEISPEIIGVIQQISSDALYLLVSVPIILSGFRIWIVSLKTAWEEKSFRHIATAGWNSYAHIRNMVNFARNAPSAAGRIFEALFGGSSKRRSKKDEGILVGAVLAVLIFAIFGGYFTANAIMKKADAEYDGFREAWDKYNHEPEYN